MPDSDTYRDRLNAAAALSATTRQADAAERIAKALEKIAASLDHISTSNTRR